MAPPLTSATIILEERVLIPTDRLNGVSEIIKNVKLGTNFDYIFCFEIEYLLVNLF